MRGIIMMPTTRTTATASNTGMLELLLMLLPLTNHDNI